MRRLAAVLASALALSACGEGSDGPAAPAQTTTTRVEVIEAQDGGRFDARAIYERDGAGVVTIYSIFGGGGLDQILGGGDPNGGVGSGFVLNGEGEIATNAHVVSQGEGADMTPAREVYVEFPDGNRVEAEVVGTDPFSDIALLRVDPQGLTLRPLRLAGDASVEVGEPVAAIGSPFGQRQSLSVGVVSATDRSVQSLTDFQISGAVQTDAAINPGNSGGPLVDADGKVIGVNQQIRTASGANEGVGYAVPVDLVKRSLDQLREEGEARYAYLGVSTQQIYPQLVERFDLPVTQGAWIQEITPGGPAEGADLRGGGRTVRFQATEVSPGGDIITRVDDTEVENPDDLSAAISLYKPGTEVELEVRRGDEARTVTVRLDERPVGNLERER
jgi:S1-C subfamily serine protease